MARIRSLGIVVLLAAPFGLLTTSTADAAVTGNCTATASFVTGTKARGPFAVGMRTPTQCVPQWLMWRSRAGRSTRRSPP